MLIFPHPLNSLTDDDKLVQGALTLNQKQKVRGEGTPDQRVVDYFASSQFSPAFISTLIGTFS